jgi:hypothetical protein
MLIAFLVSHAVNGNVGGNEYPPRICTSDAGVEYRLVIRTERIAAHEFAPTTRSLSDASSERREPQLRSVGIRSFPEPAVIEAEVQIHSRGDDYVAKSEPRKFDEYFKDDYYAKAKLEWKIGTERGRMDLPAASAAVEHLHPDTPSQLGRMAPPHVELQEEVGSDWYRELIGHEVSPVAVRNERIPFVPVRAWGLGPDSGSLVVDSISVPRMHRAGGPEVWTRVMRMGPGAHPRPYCVSVFLRELVESELSITWERSDPGSTWPTMWERRYFATDVRDSVTPRKHVVTRRYYVMYPVIQRPVGPSLPEMPEGVHAVFLGEGPIPESMRTRFQVPPAAEMSGQYGRRFLLWMVLGVAGVILTTSIILNFRSRRAVREY